MIIDPYLFFTQLPSGAYTESANIQELRRLMVVGQNGAPSINVVASVEEVFNTSREYVTIQSKFVGNIAMKFSRR